MGNDILTTTNRGGLSLAQVAGNDVYKLLPQIQSVLEHGNFGKEYVRIFSEPVENDRTIDWYIEDGQSAIPWKSLDDAAKLALMGRMQEMVGKIQGYASQLRADSDPTHKTYADILEKALIVPELEQSLYSVNGQPVLVNWGFSKGNSDVVDGTQSLLKEIQEKLEKTKDIKDFADKAASGLQSDAAAQAQPETLTPSDTSAQPSQPAASNGGSANAPSQPAPSGGSGGWVAAAVTGAALLAAGAAAMWYFLFHKPEIQESKNEPAQSLAWLKGDVEAKGVLVDENNVPVDLRLHFEGEDGIGTSYITSENQTCEGSVKAAPQEGNRVSFAMGELVCPDGHNFEPFTLVCVRGQNECAGTNKNGESWQLKVDF